MQGKSVLEMGDGSQVWPTVSVVVLNYNGRQYLGECFRSLQNLNYPQEKVELVMVDNGSGDGSVQCMDRQLCQLGLATGHNIGAREARGKYLAFLDNGIRIHPDWLIELGRSVSGEEKVSVCVGISCDGAKVDFIGEIKSLYGVDFQKGATRSGQAHGRL